MFSVIYMRCFCTLFLLYTYRRWDMFLFLRYVVFVLGSVSGICCIHIPANRVWIKEKNGNMRNTVI